VNSAWAADAIIQYAGVHLAVAVSVDDGLVTPVLRDAQSLSLREISLRVKDLASRARAKKLKPEEYQGGTLTVSNLGAYGVDQFYAIVNPPQAIILAIGAIVRKPVVAADGQIVAGERMSITLSGDHRVVDGAVGAQFLGTLRRFIENPALLLF
jgi:pyruvate dehydrogenase E2 component (dihydrolipoamide acetyltransferase)